MKTLDLSCNNFIEIPEIIKQLIKLSVLDLRGNKITQIPDFIIDMHDLHRLEITSNPIKEVSLALRNKIWELPITAKYV